VEYHLVDIGGKGAITNLSYATAKPAQKQGIYSQLLFHTWDDVFIVIGMNHRRGSNHYLAVDVPNCFCQRMTRGEN